MAFKPPQDHGFLLYIRKNKVHRTKMTKKVVTYSVFQKKPISVSFILLPKGRFLGYPVQGGPKKTHHKEMRDFLTLKMLPLALSLIKPERRHLLAPLVKNHQF